MNQARIVRKKPQLSDRTPEHILHRCIVWMIVLIMALVPGWALKFWFVGVILQKAWLFYAAATVLFVLYLVLVYLDRRWAPRFNAVGWWLMALILCLAVSTVTSVQPMVSFWGDFSRMEGLVAWIYYGLFFIVTTSVLRSPNDWWLVLRGAILGALGVSLYALAPKFNWSWALSALDPNRLEGSLGNPVFLGGYLAMIIPLTIAGLAKSRKTYWGAISWVVLGLSLIVLALTFARGAWLATGVGMVGWLVLYIVKKRRSVKWMASIAGISLGVVLLGAVIIAASGSASQPWSRVFNTESLNLRWDNWRAAVQVIAERPVLGWGLENYNIGFSKYYRPPSNIATAFRELHADRAHSEYLDMAASGGIITLVAYLGLLISALWISCRRLKRKSISHDAWLINAGCLVTIVAFMIYVLLAFHLITNILLLLLVLAWVNSETEQPLSRNKKSPPRAIIRLIIAISGSAVLLAGLWFTVGLPARAVTAANRGIEALYRDEYGSAVGQFNRAVAYGSWMTNPIRLHMAVLGSLQSPSDDAGWRDFQLSAAAGLADNLQRQPLNQYTWLISGIYYGMLAPRYPEFVTKAEASFKTAAELAPYTAEPIFKWGQMYTVLNQPKLAEDKFRRALELEPNNVLILFPVSKWYLATNNLSSGADYARRALELKYCPVFTDVQAVRQILAGGDRELLESFYRRIIDCSPDKQEQVYAIIQLALLYRDTGNLNQALELAKSLQRYDINPSELQKFRAELNLEF